MAQKRGVFAIQSNRNVLLQGTWANTYAPKKRVKTLPAIDSRVLLARGKIQRAKARLETWRAVAEWLGDVSKATACNRLLIDQDFRPSIGLIEMIERAELPPHYVQAPACPDCGEVHTGRCHNKTVIQVVVLAPGERVTAEPAPVLGPVAPPRKRKKYHRPCMDDAEYADWLQWKAERRTHERNG